MASPRASSISGPKAEAEATTTQQNPSNTSTAALTASDSDSAVGTIDTPTPSPAPAKVHDNVKVADAVQIPSVEGKHDISIEQQVQHAQQERQPPAFEDEFVAAPSTATTSLVDARDVVWDVDDGYGEGEGDSAYGDDDTASSYGSLTSEAREYTFENGRRYHGYKAGRYMIPNDEKEMDREDMKHHITMLITEGRLHLAPIPENPQNILDIGTGTGIWAIEIADQYPSAKVIATDLSPIQPAWIPPNLIIEIDDAEDTWLYHPSTFDLIHIRYLFHGIRSWPRLFSQALTALAPGGYIELVELHVVPTSPDNTLPPDSQITALYSVLADIAGTIGLDLDIAPKFPGLLEEAGFVDVRAEVFDLPLGDWMHGRRMKEVGSFQRFQMTEGLQGMATGLLTRVAGWGGEKVEVFLAGVRAEMLDRKVHSMYKMHFVYGRKPLSMK